jgi:streptogramin lyase
LSPPEQETSHDADEGLLRRDRVNRLALSEMFRAAHPFSSRRNSWAAGPSSTITIDQDGNVWYPQSGNQTIGRRTLAGEATEVPISEGAPNDICVGSRWCDWFVDGFLQRIGRIEPSGFFRTFDLPPKSSPERIVAGRDKALWFTERSINKIGRISTTGTKTITHYPIPTESSEPYGIAIALDGTVWFTESATGNEFCPPALRAR